MKRLRRLLTIIAVLIVPAGLLIFGLQGYIVRNAVVTAELVELRAPISGDITRFDVRRGSYLPERAAIVSISDPRRDERQVEETTNRLARVEADLAARRAELAALDSEIDGLDRRLNRSLDSLHADLALRQEIAQAQRVGLVARIDYLTKQFERAKRLQGSAASQSAMEAADADMQEATAEMQALDLTIARLAQQQGYLADRLLIADLADDAIAVDGDLRDLRQSRREAALAIDLLQNELDALRGEQASATRHLAKVGTVELELPDDSVVWEVHKSLGSSIAEGVKLLSYLSCDGRFVEAAIDDSTVELLQPDHPVTVHLYGSHVAMPGHIRLVYGSAGEASAQEGLAAHVGELGGNDAVVLIAIEPATPEARQYRLCDIGRTAWVEFDGIGLLDPLLNRIF